MSKQKKLAPAARAGEAPLQAPRSAEERTAALVQAIDYIENRYLSQLSDQGKYKIIGLDKKVDNLAPSQIAQLFRITDIIYAKEEDFLQKAVTVLYTAYALKANVVVLLKSAGDRCEYYLGLSMPEDKGNLVDHFDSFRSVFEGNYMGSRVEALKAAEEGKPWELDELLKHTFKKDSAISSVSGLPSLRSSDKHTVKNFIQGIENLTDSLRGCEYTLMVLASPVSEEELNTLRAAYEGIYTNLSCFAKTEHNYNRTTATGTESSTSSTHTVTVTRTRSEGQNTGSSFAKQHTDSVNKSRTIDKGAIAAGAIMAGTALAVAAAPVTGGASVGIAAASLAGMAAGGMGSVLRGMLGTETTGTTSSDSTSETMSTTMTVSDSESKGESESVGQTVGVSEQNTFGGSVQFSVEDKRVQDILKIIEKNLDRLEKCRSFGTFSSCAYVISSSPAVNKRVAAVYSALMRGDASFAQSAQINTWVPSATFKDDVLMLQNYLKHFTHPRFEYRIGRECAPVTPALLVSGEELALQIGLPKRALPGLSVREMAEFGCNPPPDSNGVRLGSVQRLGKKVETPVFLDKKSLTAHTFITGSTGSGKSFTVYQLLKELCFPAANDKKQEKTPAPKFLVIEPAKGEYKDVFGRKDGVTVYGTNPYLSRLLRLNPFAFPTGSADPKENILVLEHIDRLVEIFNACWPMYAAMPAVLKDAMEEAYKSCGWNLTRSTCVYDPPRFPTFATLLQKLPEIISSSAYSSDTKGDYTGALVTRVKSLTNGINGQIFGSEAEPIWGSLFDENVIVDLSRVGSTETKSLIMGILMIQLLEYRMAKKSGSNSELKHVTVLEEAHNLLRRTSPDQSQEGANLQGKSVEMLANAIAEMRTYGEGFVIADQAPGLLDMAVIRNTNTKIIMRLPDQEDRELVGKAANLTDDQITELARLDTGVAAVFQNHWVEPVLCQVDQFEDTPGTFSEESGEPETDALAPTMDPIFDRILNGSKDGGELRQEDVDRLCRLMSRLGTGHTAQDTLLDALYGDRGHEKENLDRAFYCLLKGSSFVTKTDHKRVPVSDAEKERVDGQIMDILDVSEALAAQIRRLVFTYAAQIEDDRLKKIYLDYGRVK